MFFRVGNVTYPQTPFLSVSAVWIGGAFRVRGSSAGIGDTGRLLLGIGGGPWGYAQRYAIVSMSDYCYTLYGGGKMFRPIPLRLVTPDNGVVVEDSMRWVSDNGESLWFTGGGWYIDCAEYGEGNRYSVEFGHHNATATPVGPWTQEEDPPSGITLDIDWPRRTCFHPVGLFAPATNYCRTPPAGDIQTGVPTWSFVYAGVSYVAYRTQAGYAAPTGRLDPSYIVEDAGGDRAAALVWDPDEAAYVSMTRGGNKVKAGVPAPGDPWTLTLDRADGTTETIAAAWDGYEDGCLSDPLFLCEPARLFGEEAG